MKNAKNPFAGKKSGKEDEGRMEGGKRKKGMRKMMKRMSKGR